MRDVGLDVQAHVEVVGHQTAVALARGQGAQGWFGWWKNDRAEELAEAWVNAPDEGRQRALASELGRLALDEAAFVPLGQFVIRTAFRRDITGILPGSSPYPWNVRRA